MPVLDRLVERPLVRRALVPASTLVGVLVAGVVGFSAFGNVGLLEAAFWVVDPTSLELHFQAHPEGPERVTKAYALAVFVAVVVTSLWTGETVVQAVFGGRIRDELERVRMERRIDALDGHVLVCGFGMFGRTITERLVAAGRDVVVVEREEANLERLPDDALSLVGDARTEETLRRAGVTDADAVVAAIDDSNANVQIAIIARQLGPDCRLVVRVGDELYEETARRAGADEVIIPEVTSGIEATELL